MLGVERSWENWHLYSPIGREGREAMGSRLGEGALVIIYTTHGKAYSVPHLQPTISHLQYHWCLECLQLLSHQPPRAIQGPWTNQLI